jgi:hypothetical protein
MVQLAQKEKWELKGKKVSVVCLVCQQNVERWEILE